MLIEVAKHCWVDPVRVSFIRLTPRSVDRYDLQMVVDGESLSLGPTQGSVEAYHIILDYILATGQLKPLPEVIRRELQ